MKPSLLRALAILMLVAISGCGSPDPDLSEQNAQEGDASGEILFVASGDVHLWDGDIHQITRDTHAMSPRWAPAGDHFVYVEMHADLGYSDLMVADRDGDVLQQVTENRPDAEPYSWEFARYVNWAMDPDWSPAGEQLAWVSDKGGWEAPENVERYSDPLYLWYSETWIVAPYLLLASENIPITSEGIGVTQESPSFSPDGDHLAFVARGEPTEIWTIDLNGGELTPLVSGAEGAYDPAWSPGDQHIAFIQRQDTRNDIWAVPADGGEPYELVPECGCASPAWSPDGRFLAFFRLVDAEFEEWYVEIDITGSGQITASEPHHLFSMNDIDVPSGMSWHRSE